LIDPNVALYHDQSVYKKPETKKDFPWHQDNGYTPIEPEQYLTCWIALEDATIENGCIWPGTHKQGPVEHVRTKTGLLCYFGKDPGIPVPLQKGGVAVFFTIIPQKRCECQ
jgi:phytanoyl-CoA hydroxylase